MNDFQKKFLEEATDLILNLEENILILDKNFENKELIEEIFRTMHSLKGGGGMFGFDKITNLTHNLETVYDFIRSDKEKVTKELVNLTFQSVDILKIILEDRSLEIQENKINYENLIKKIDDFTKKFYSNNKNDNENNNHIENKELKTFYIYFQTNEKIFDNGTNPIFLMEDLSEFSEIRIFPILKKIPNFEKLDIYKSYISWNIILSTKEDENHIRDIFIFIENENIIKIKKISDDNLLKNENFISHLKSNDEIFNSELKIEFFEIFKKNVKNPKIKILKNKNFNEFLKKNIISSIRVSSEKLDNLVNLIGELVTTQASLSLFAEQNKSNKLDIISENVENLTRELRDIVLDISLLPLDTLFLRFKRLLRDLSENFGKEINFIIEGGDTELDKSLIQILSEPLMHILRNAVSHGIEKPEERIKNNKNRKGTILLKSYHSGANVCIEIKDDGKGIDIEKIKKKAFEKNLINENNNLNNEEILNFIFYPNFSTSKKIDNISGRGVGLDVAKKKINDAKGDIKIHTKFGEGTSFIIKVPITVSIIDSLLLKIDSLHFIVPVISVEKIISIKEEDLKNNFNSMLIYEDKKIPFFYLRKEFNLLKNIPKLQQGILIFNEKTLLILIIDEVLGEHQAVLKPIGKHFKNQEFISGASIMGDGNIALVLDTNKILKYFLNKK